MQSERVKYQDRGVSVTEAGRNRPSDMHWRERDIQRGDRDSQGIFTWQSPQGVAPVP